MYSCTNLYLIAFCAFHDNRYDEFIAQDLLLKPEDLSGSAAPIVHILAVLTFFIERMFMSATLTSVVLFYSFICIVRISLYSTACSKMRRPE